MVETLSEVFNLSEILWGYQLKEICNDNDEKLPSPQPFKRQPCDEKRK